MARRSEHVYIVSEDIDIFLGRVLVGLAAIGIAVMVAIQLYRWFVR